MSVGKGWLSGCVVDALIENYHRGDPEWKFQAGFLGDLLENDVVDLAEKDQEELAVLAGMDTYTKEGIISWCNAQKKGLN